MTITEIERALNADPEAGPILGSPEWYDVLGASLGEIVKEQIQSRDAKIAGLEARLERLERSG